MFCNNCGTKLPEHANFCPVCGAKVTVKDIPAQNNREDSPESQTFNEQLQNFVSDNIKESSFASNMLWSKGCGNILIFLFFFVALLNAVSISGCLELDDSKLDRRILSLIHLVSLFPNEVIDFISQAVEIFIIVVLMKFFSTLHKPLKKWFIANIIGSILLYLITIITDGMTDSEETGIVLGIFLLGCSEMFLLVLTIGLGISIICNYEGKIKTFGWISILYICIGLTVLLLKEVAIFDPLTTGSAIFIIELIYYICFVDLITK